MLLVGCTRTVQPITLAELRPAAQHLAALSAPPPDQVLTDVWIPLWGRSAPTPGHVVVGAIGGKVPMLDVDLRSGQMGWSSSLLLEPLEGGPPDWYWLSGYAVAMDRAMIHVIDPKSGASLGTVPIVGPTRVDFHPGDASALVVDALSKNKARIRSLDPRNGQARFAKEVPLPTHAASTGSYAVRVSAGALSREAMADGESRTLEGAFQDVKSVIPLGETHIAIVRATRTDILDLVTMAQTSSTNTGELVAVAAGLAPTLPVALQPSPKARPPGSTKKPLPPPTPALTVSFAAMTRTRRLILIGQDGTSRFDTALPFVGEPRFTEAGLFVHDTENAALVGWDGAVRWKKSLPPWLAHSAMRPMLADRTGTVILANERGVVSLDLESGSLRYAFAVRGAAPDIQSLATEGRLTGEIDGAGAAAREAQLGNLLGVTREVGNGGGGQTVTGFAVGASLFSSSSLLRAQAMGIVAADARRARYADSHALAQHIAEMGARSLLQGEYYVRRLHWFWGQGALVVRLRDGAWREALTGPASSWGKTFDCHSGIGIVSDNRLLTVGMRAPTSAFVASAGPRGRAPCPVAELQMWDLSSHLRPANEYSTHSIVGEND